MKCSKLELYVLREIHMGIILPLTQRTQKSSWRNANDLKVPHLVSLRQDCIGTSRQTGTPRMLADSNRKADRTR